VPVQFFGTPNISEGDTVRVVGYLDGEFDALALRNYTTSVVYHRNGEFSNDSGCLPIVVGFFVLPFGIFAVHYLAIFFLVSGCFCLLGLRNYRRTRSRKQLVTRMLQ
jgi:hypothetical protein